MVEKYMDIVGFLHREKKKDAADFHFYITSFMQH